jgi:hypothetical protein
MRCLEKGGREEQQARKEVEEEQASRRGLR